MKIEKKVLKNGVKIFGVNNPNLNSISIHFGFKVGSRLEDNKYSGISHFLEHMIFKGSKKYPSHKIISGALDSMGAVNNAETDKEYTQYYAQVLTKYFDTALDIIADTCLNPLIDPKELEKERGTIIEELNFYDANPISNISHKAERVLWGDNSLGWDTGGEIKTVRNIDAKTMKSYQNKYYTGKNLSVVVYGKLPKDYQKKIEKLVSTLKPGESTSWEYPGINPEKGEIYYKESEQTMIAITLPTYSLKDEERLASKLLAMILGGYMSSRLFIEIREKRGWAYAINAYSAPYTDTGIFGIVGGIRNDKVEESFKLIKKELLKIAGDLTQEEVDRAKGALLGSREINLENPDVMANFLTLRTILTGKPEEPSVEYSKIEKITKDDLVKVAKKLFKTESMRFAVIGPFKDKEKFAKILTQD